MAVERVEEVCVQIGHTGTVADVKCALRQRGLIGSERDRRLVQLAVLRNGVELANHVPALSGPLPPPQDLQLVVSAPRHMYVGNGAIELPESITQWNFSADGYRVVCLQADVNAVGAGLFRRVEALGEVHLAAGTHTVNLEAFAAGASPRCISARGCGILGHGPLLGVQH